MCVGELEQFARYVCGGRSHNLGQLESAFEFIRALELID